VLDKVPHRDADSRYALFTKKFGKLTAKATSARKITSKLSPHLEPGNVVQARLVEKNGLQVVDALKTGRITATPRDLEFLGLLLAEAEPDARIWIALLAPRFHWPEVLRALGWDPAHAACEICEKKPAVFAIKTQEFFCGDHALNMSKDGVLYI